MSSFLRAVVLCATAAGAACATSSQETQPSLPQSFGSSDSTASMYAAPPAVASALSADLVVVPDLACVPFVVEARTPRAADSLAAARAAVDALVAAAGPGARVRFDDLSLQADGAAKVSPDDAPVQAVTVSGVVEAPLPAGDFWTRAARANAVELDVEAAAGAATSETRTTRVGGAVPGIADVEAHRPALVAAWAARARELAAATSSAAAPVLLAGCTPPRGIDVVGGTFERVGLVLAVACTFSTGAAGGAHATP